MNLPKYALALMDVLVTDEEMSLAGVCGGSRGSKPELPQEKIKLIQRFKFMY